MAEVLSTPVYSTQIGLALSKAVEWHQYQLRKDGLPYISHLLRVMGYVWQFTKDEDVVIGALLHDAVEDVGISLSNIQVLFGPSVASIVRYVTEDKDLPKLERKQQYIKNLQRSDCPVGSVIVSMLDKYDNLQCLLSQPDLVSSDLLDFMVGLIMVYEHKVEEGVLVSEGCKPYTQLLSDMKVLVNQLSK